MMYGRTSVAPLVAAGVAGGTENDVMIGGDSRNCAP
jgi:hypothetical protein